jgi:hypothetical protein
MVFNECFIIEKMHGKYNVKYSLIRPTPSLREGNFSGG